jgi:hypothetical protein
VVRITHEGVGFGLLSQKLPVSQITPEMVEEEAMKFLKRLFGQEQLRRPIPAPRLPGVEPADRDHGHRMPPVTPAVSSISRSGSELLYL